MKPKEKPRKVNVSITLEVKDKEKGDRIAELWGTSFSETMRRLLSQFDLESLN